MAVSEYSLDDVKKIFKEHWRPGWGSIASDEVLFVQDYIKRYQPKKFLEVGMASGLSGGLISQMLDWNDGKSFTSIDYNDTFFGDNSKKNGFLIEEIYAGDSVVVEKQHFVIAPGLTALNRRFDMCFIDANHQHPWPLIDTLCVFPFLDNQKVMIHHDLKLYRNQDVVRGIGPKYLFDQFPEATRDKSVANDGNIFALTLGNVSFQEIEDVAIGGFHLPWSLFAPLSNEIVSSVKKVFTEFYSPRLIEAFDLAISRHNNT